MKVSTLANEAIWDGDGAVSNRNVRLIDNRFPSLQVNSSFVGSGDGNSGSIHYSERSNNRHVIEEKDSSPRFHITFDGIERWKFWKRSSPQHDDKDMKEQTTTKKWPLRYFWLPKSRDSKQKEKNNKKEDKHVTCQRRRVKHRHRRRSSWASVVNYFHGAGNSDDLTFWMDDQERSTRCHIDGTQLLVKQKAVVFDRPSLAKSELPPYYSSSSDDDYDNNSVFLFNHPHGKIRRHSLFSSQTTPYVAKPRKLRRASSLSEITTLLNQEQRERALPQPAMPPQAINFLHDPSLRALLPITAQYNRKYKFQMGIVNDSDDDEDDDDIVSLTTATIVSKPKRKTRNRQNNKHHQQQQYDSFKLQRTAASNNSIDSLLPPINNNNKRLSSTSIHYLFSDSDDESGEGSDYLLFNPSNRVNYHGDHDEENAYESDASSTMNELLSMIHHRHDKKQQRRPQLQRNEFWEPLNDVDTTVIRPFTSSLSGSSSSLLLSHAFNNNQNNNESYDSLLSPLTASLSTMSTMTASLHSSQQHFFPTFPTPKRLLEFQPEPKQQALPPRQHNSRQRKAPLLLAPQSRPQIIASRIKTDGILIGRRRDLMSRHRQKYLSMTPYQDSTELHQYEEPDKDFPSHVVIVFKNDIEESKPKNKKETQPSGKARPKLRRSISDPALGDSRRRSSFGLEQRDPSNRYIFPSEQEKAPHRPPSRSAIGLPPIAPRQPPKELPPPIQQKTNDEQRDLQHEKHLQPTTITDDSVQSKDINENAITTTTTTTDNDIGRDIDKNTRHRTKPMPVERSQTVPVETRPTSDPRRSSVGIPSSLQSMRPRSYHPLPTTKIPDAAGSISLQALLSSPLRSPVKLPQCSPKESPGPEGQSCRESLLAPTRELPPPLPNLD